MQTLKDWLCQLGGALVFYTILPLPQHWPLEFSRIARWAPWIGGLIGVFLTLTNHLLQQWSASDLLRGVLVTALWILITGGLHLDGVMDTADGLAVLDPERRLSVMSDSRTGAFGAIAAIVLVLLKVAAISDLSPNAPLWVIPIWGRWAQWYAIARYPYLKPDGKGAFHRRSLKLPQDLGPSLVLFLGILGLYWHRQPSSISGLKSGLTSGLASGLTPGLVSGLLQTGISLGIAWGVGAWFNQRFHGMTGDLYGAITEWTEALILCSFSLGVNF
ncbi:MAG: adenosylcobinamide-GDP ribazoletransferase [Thermosynechococcaceae cyanobacterium MS004]|nr:adenosylcobinamide-GDP ribazoletransferase [Thermosynechococcaceae cyanobacterium MS004]